MSFGTFINLWNYVIVKSSTNFPLKKKNVWRVEKYPRFLCNSNKNIFIAVGLFSRGLSIGPWLASPLHPPS